MGHYNYSRPVTVSIRTRILYGKLSQSILGSGYANLPYHDTRGTQSHHYGVDPMSVPVG